MPHKKYIAVILFALFASLGNLFAQHEHSEHNQAVTTQAHSEAEGKPDIGAMIIHHVSDAHEFHVLNDLSIPLPCIVYHPKRGFECFLSSTFKHGHQAHNGYVLQHGTLTSIEDPTFPMGDVPVSYTENHQTKQHEAVVNGKNYSLSRSNFYDFSITKVVFTMLLTAFLLLVIFIGVAKGYAKRSGAPKGIQSFFEPIILFIRDEVAKPNLGSKYQKYMPYLLTVFFFIWINNLLGLIPFFPGGGNVMGNISMTLTLALFTFILTNIGGTKYYWAHIFNPPGVPMAIKPIVILIEFLSVFIKPFALMIRLFANMAAGHIIILSLVGIIFIFAHMFGSGAGFGVSIVSCLFMLFMNCLELLVAALQAYIFTMLSAVFIGQAIEDHHHPEEAHH